MSVSYQTDTDLLALEVADDDMIWVIQKEKRIEILLVWSDIMLTTNWNLSYQTKTDLQAVEVADDDMIWVIK